LLEEEEELLETRGSKAEGKMAKDKVGGHYLGKSP